MLAHFYKESEGLATIECDDCRQPPHIEGPVCLAFKSGTNRRSVAAQFDRFEREYPARVISRVLGPWGDLVVQSAKKTRSFKNRTGNLRRNMAKTVIRQRALEVRFSSPGGALERGTKRFKARNFWRAPVRRNRSKLGPIT